MSLTDLYENVLSAKEAEADADARRPFPIRAMPGRLILRFPPPQEQTRGGLIIPQTSQQRIEVAEIYDIGAARKGQKDLRAYFLGLQLTGKRLLVTFGSGVGFWHNDDKKADLGTWEWIKDFRSYRMEEPSAFLEAE